MVLVGPATRLARFVEQESKRYVATARFGVRTTTDDLTGAVLPGGEPGVVERLTEREVGAALRGFLGSYHQQPPRYSAKKVAGKPSYARARRGEAVELAPVEVTVHAVALREYRPPDATFEATVSRGTYLRALGRDWGERLGVGAHLVALRRLAIGPLRVESAVQLGELTAGTPLLTPRQILAHLPAIELDIAAQRDVAHGRPIHYESEDAPWVALVAGERLLAVARTEGEWLRPTVVLGAG